MNGYQLVSELYRLLGQMDEDTLRDLGRMSIAPDLRAVVDAMVGVRQASRAGLPGDQGEPLPLAANERHVQVGVMAKAERSLEPSVTEVFDGAKRLTNLEFVKLLRRAGLVVPPRAKDGRRELELKALRVLERTPPKRRAEILMNALRLLATGETEGWVEAIRSVNRE